jgi:hypothetical protein
MWIAGQGCRRGGIFGLISFGIHFDEAALSAGENFTGAVADLANVVVTAAFVFGFARFDYQIFVDRNWTNVFDCKFGGDGANVLEAIHLAHCFVENEGNDAAVDEAASALIVGADAERAADALRGIVLFEGEQHAARVCGAAAEAGVCGIGCE